LADLSRVVLDNAHTGTGASVRPHLPVTVSWTELQALATKNAVGTGVTGVVGVNGFGTPGSKALIATPAVFTETNTPVPASLLRRIACNSQVTRIVSDLTPRSWTSGAPSAPSPDSGAEQSSERLCVRVGGGP
jgi:hypothetical protein